MSVRLRLTALYAALLLATTVVLLGVSYWLMDGHLHRTLPETYADDVLGRLLGQYGVAVVGTLLLAVGIGWLIAGRVLAPLRRMSATARRVSESRLDERVALEGGPNDELHELASTLDAMLDRLEGSVDAQRRFVANASHELRSPLTVIRTEADVTLSDPDATVADLRQMGHVVLEATDRTEALLDGLLVLARSQRGVSREREVDLAVVTRRAAAPAAVEAVRQGVAVDVDAEPVRVRGDEPLLERLVANLTENAVRHNERGGYVHVRARQDGDEAVIDVVNGGARIPADAVPRLTEPFERLGRAADGSGSGLGLSIVRAVAEAHGGRLRLGARPAGGLEAEVRLPLIHI